MDILFPIARWLSTPKILEKMVKVPVAKMKNNVRHYEEHMDSNAAINIHNDIKNRDIDAFVVYIVLGLDGTPLSSTGSIIVCFC